jgi:hypothetical protein
MRYVRSMHESEDGESDGSGVKVQKLNLQPGRARNTNRYSKFDPGFLLPWFNLFIHLQG